MPELDSYNTPTMKKKKQILSEEKKAQKKIYMAEYRLKNKARKKILDAKWRKDNPSYINPARIENPNYDKEAGKRFHKANPNYSNEHSHKHDLGYWVVYLIHNFDGLNNIYCGQTQNIYTRMKKHRSLGKLNTKTHEILEKFDNVDEALGFESTLHLAGYHGKYTRGH